MTARRFIALLGVFALFILLFTQFTAEPIIFDTVPQVEASCAVILDPQPLQVDDDIETQTLTLIITTPDGTPLPGLCLTFTRDTGPGASDEIIGRCTTDEEGLCTIEVPNGVVNVYFGNARVGGLPVGNGQGVVNTAIDDATNGGVTYYSNGSDPVSTNLVANDNGDGSVDMVHATENEDGDLVPLEPGIVFQEPPRRERRPRATREPNREAPIGSEFGGPDETPVGVVSVHFFPETLRTTDSYDSVYCFYSVNDEGLQRIPGGVGTFLAGGGTFFDLGGILNGDSAPASLLDADEEIFTVNLQCWGWQGDDLVQIGSLSFTAGPDVWTGESLVASEGNLSLDYHFNWRSSEVEPTDPELDNATQQDDTITVPTNVRFAGEVIAWDYGDEDVIGGFTIYRNGHLIGTAPPASRGWQGDGLVVSECGENATYQVSAFIAGFHSPLSEAVMAVAPACIATVRFSVPTVTLTNINDCDAGACGSAAEVYGYIAVNEQTIQFGNAQLIGVIDGTFTLPISTVEVNLGPETGLAYDIVLFDFDAGTPDDVLCAVSEAISSEDLQLWLAGGGQQLTREAVGAEANCSFTINISE